MMLLYMLCSLATARVSLCTCAVISMFRCHFGVEFELSSSANSVGLLSHHDFTSYMIVFELGLRMLLGVVAIVFDVSLSFA